VTSISVNRKKEEGGHDWPKDETKRYKKYLKRTKEKKKAQTNISVSEEKSRDGK